MFLYITVNVHMPRDRVSLNHQGYGFVEFISEEDADYAIRIMNMIKVTILTTTFVFIFRLLLDGRIIYFKLLI